MAVSNIHFSSEILEILPTYHEFGKEYVRLVYMEIARFKGLYMVYKVTNGQLLSGFCISG